MSIVAEYGAVGGTFLRADPPCGYVIWWPGYWGQNSQKKWSLEKAKFKLLNPIVSNVKERKSFKLNLIIVHLHLAKPLPTPAHPSSLCLAPLNVRMNAVLQQSSIILCHADKTKC